MKKVVYTFLGLLGFVLPSLAQVSHDYDPNDKEPIVKATITKDQVPEAVLKAASVQFNKDNPGTWSKFPYQLKEYGWVYDVNSTQKDLDHFEVTLKNTKGNVMEAVYNADGSLIQTRERSANVPVPKEVMTELGNSKYKDWAIIGDKEIINYYRDRNNANVERHFRITVEKGKERRSISFNWKGEN